MTRLPVAVRVGLWMTLTAVSFAALVGLVRHLSAELDVFVIAFWRNLFGSLFFIPWLLRMGPGALRTRRLPLFGLRALTMVVSSTALFFSVVLLPLAEATALSFTSPLFATALAVLVLKERVGTARWSALAVGFAGVLVILRPGMAAFDPAALIVLLSAATFAAIVVMGKQLAATESPALITLYLSLLSVPLSLVPAAFVWQWPTAEQLVWLGAVGAMAIANMYGIARAMRIGDASMAMPYDFIRLPCTALVGFLAFGQRPDLWTWVGAAIIFASALFVAHREAVRRTSARPR